MTAPIHALASVAAYRSFARGPRTLSPGSAVIHVCGVPASGKSWLAERLATVIKIPLFGIDAERLAVTNPGECWPEDDSAAWFALERKIDAEPICIVETSGSSLCDVVLFRGRKTHTVECLANVDTRRRRLEERLRNRDRYAVGMDNYISRMIDARPPLVRGESIMLDTSYPNAESVDRIISWARRVTAR